MENKLIKFDIKRKKIFKLFYKMIEKLIKQNEQLEKIKIEAEDKTIKYNQISIGAAEIISENNNEIKKLKQFVGEDNE
jgi:hypothetical protein